MKRLILTAGLVWFLFLVLAVLSFADPVSLDTARFIGIVHLEAQERLWLNQPLLAPQSFSEGRKFSVLEIRVLKDLDGRILAYILDLNPGGFIAISADTDIRPVIAYSFEGRFSIDDTPQNVLLHLLKWDMRNRLEALPITPEWMRQENNAFWDEYLTEQIDFQAASQWPPDDDTGWLDTTWGQSSFYNDSCPDDPNTSPGFRYDSEGRYIGGTTDGRCLTGCTATAMGQIVNYWGYPSSVYFSSDDNYTSLMDPDDGYGTRTIQINASDANMPIIDYNNGNPSQSTIADLLFACGVAVDMRYSDSGSGAWPSAAAYTYHFGYTSAERKEGNKADFYDVLQDNMKNGQPAQLAIYEFDGATYIKGHSIVADGYRSTDHYHLNFGWGASSPDPIAECWYSLPEGMPAGYNVVYCGILNIYAGAVTELLVNGGFEFGSTGWVLSGDFYADLRFAYPHSGSGYAYVSDPDGSPGNNLIGWMYQLVTIPTNAVSPVLTFWYNITSQEQVTEPRDVLDVTIQDSNGGFLATVAVFSNLDKDPAAGNPYYHQESFDMTPYKGQTIRLHFLAATDNSNPTTFRIDDVSISTTYPSNTAPTISGVPDRTLSEDSSWDNAIDLWAYASDTETEDSGLIFSIIGNTSPNCGVNIDGSNRYIDIDPADNWYGYSDVTVEVTDPGDLSDTDTFRITVNPVNDPPTILSTIPNQSADKNVPIIIDLTSYESDIEDSATLLDWYVEDEDSCTVTGEYSDDDVLTFTPWLTDKSPE